MTSDVKSGISVRQIVFAGIVGALYATLTIAVAPLSYGSIQFRFAEALCVLPFFFPVTVPGLFVGCVVANLISPFGILDIAAGSMATLIAALLTMYLGRLKRNTVVVKALACFPPVIVNAVIIGAVIAWVETGGGPAFWGGFAINGLQVGLGQFAVLYVIGLPIMIYLPKSRVFIALAEHLAKN